MGHVAFYTFGILRAARGEDQVQGFYDRTEATHATATTMPGHLATYRGDIDTTTFGPRFFIPGVHPRAPQTLSLWVDLASVHAFAYGGPHAEALRLRKEWFLPPAWPSYAVWWVGDEETPSWSDAPGRLEHLHDHGPTPYAFNFRTPFDEYGQQVQVLTTPRGAP
jgi:hypothetical protein